MDRIVTAGASAGHASASDGTLQDRAAQATWSIGYPIRSRMQPRSIPGPDTLHLECRRAVEGA